MAPNFQFEIAQFQTAMVVRDKHTWRVNNHVRQTKTFKEENTTCIVVVIERRGWIGL
jgi:hypothetical protein